jgi:hypothetical protein
MRGKVFGVCFEVIGPLSSPGFYLCDKSKVIQGFTEENEFDW